MSVPLLAPFRMHFTYTIALQTHEMNIYCDATLVSSDYEIILNAGGTIATDDASDGMAAAFGDAYGVATLTSLGYRLDERVSNSWVPRKSGASTVSGVSGQTYWPASQMTFVLRDIANKFARVQFMECYIAPPYHYTNSAALPADITGIYGPFTAAGAGSFGPYKWMLSRGGNALTADSIVGCTGDLNDKLRRQRGLV